MNIVRWQEILKCISTHIQTYPSCGGCSAQCLCSRIQGIIRQDRENDRKLAKLIFGDSVSDKEDHSG